MKLRVFGKDTIRSDNESDDCGIDGFAFGFSTGGGDDGDTGGGTGGGDGETGGGFGFDSGGGGDEEDKADAREADDGVVAFPLWKTGFISTLGESLALPLVLALDELSSLPLSRSLVDFHDSGCRRGT